MLTVKKSTETTHGVSLVLISKIVHLGLTCPSEQLLFEGAEQENAEDRAEKALECIAVHPFS